MEWQKDMRGVGGEKDLNAVNRVRTYEIPPKQAKIKLK